MAKSLRTPLPSPVESSASASSSVAARQVPGREGRRMIGLLFLGLGFVGLEAGVGPEVIVGGAGMEAGCGLFWREGGGERRDA